LFDAFGAGMRDGRSVHMCGQSTHLHQVLVDDMRMTSFNIFGYLVDPKVAARNLGGKTLLWGNINPMLMLNGSRQDVLDACRECLQALAPCGGLMLGDGANVCPGTPLENLAALTDAAEEFGAVDIITNESRNSRTP
jgi:uroporphyrinogen decarboxylase